MAGLRSSREGLVERLLEGFGLDLEERSGLREAVEHENAEGLRLRRHIFVCDVRILASCLKLSGIDID